MSKWTGFDRHTIAARLSRANIEAEPDSPGNSRQFESAPALAALYGAPLSSVETVRQRRAELLAAQTERARHELTKERGGYIPLERHQRELAEMTLRFREFVLRIPDMVELAQPLDPTAHYRIRRAGDEFLELCGRYLQESGVRLDAMLADAAPTFEHIGSIGDDELIVDHDALERFSNAPYEQFCFRIAADPPRYVHFMNANLGQLLELERQLTALKLTIPQAVKDRIQHAQSIAAPAAAPA